MRVHPRVYLAGPDVFFPEPEQWAARKKTICGQYGLMGVSPLDDLPDEPAEWVALPFWRKIAQRNEAHIRSCQALIANVTPFRGPSADVGTIYEIGFARALGLKIFGYATVMEAFLSRTLAALGDAARTRPDGAWLDGDGLLVEQFGLFDNLMIEGGIVGSGGELIIGDADRWSDLSLFERCVATAARQLHSVSLEQGAR
jgi:nucleoside 2-deoxyribosyltransferase